MKTKYIKTAMSHIVTRIRPDMVMHVAFIKTRTGGHYCMWVTPAGAHNEIKWELAEFCEDSIKPNIINLPTEVTNYTDEECEEMGYITV